MEIKTKSVLSPIDRDGDGLRILATRYRGQGMKKSRYDVWMAALGPSEKLLKKRQMDQISSTRFKTLYRREILGKDEKDSRNPLIKNRGQKFSLRLLKKLSRQCREREMVAKHATVCRLCSDCPIRPPRRIAAELERP